MKRGAAKRPKIHITLVCIAGRKARVPDERPEAKLALRPLSP